MSHLHINHEHVKSIISITTGHSTETATLKVLADIPVLMVVNEGNMAALALLDLSSAFDSVDHDALLQRLQTSYGFDSVALS